MEKKRKLYVFFLLLLIVVKIFLVRYQPLLAYTNAAFDDRHFIDQAKSILAGDWLGIYNQYTLIKGPFLSIWIVFTFLLGIPFLLSLQFLHAFSCLVLVTALEPFLRRRRYSLLLFSALLFNPVTFDTSASTRVTRDALYASLCTLTLACAMSLFLRRNERLSKNLPWALGLGLAFSASALTREETAWLGPSLLFIFALSWIGLSENGFKNRVIKISIWGLLPLTYLILVGMVSSINYRYYSIFNVTEMKAPEFIAAYSAMQRVVPPQFKPRVPVSKKTRKQIYSVSPAFKELEPYLEGPIGNGWSSVTIPGLDLPKGEIIGGWFIWTFRDAVAAAGYYSNGKFPVQYYQKLANEINMACDTGKLECINKPASLAPVWNKKYIEPALESSSESLKLLVTFGGLNSHLSESNTEGEGEMLFRDLTQNEIAKLPEITYTVTGWALNKEREVYEIITENEKVFVSDTKIISNLPSLDVYNYFLSQGKTITDAKSSRFILITSCSRNCRLEIRSGNETLAKFKLDDLISPTYWDDTKTFVSIDSKGSFLNGLVYQDKYHALKVVALDWIIRLYQRVFPPFTIVAIFVYVFLIIQVKKRFSGWGLVSTLGLTSIARLGLLSIISASSFPAIYILYLSPAYPTLIAFTILSIILLFDTIDLEYIQHHKTENQKSKNGL